MFARGSLPVQSFLSIWTLGWGRPTHVTNIRLTVSVDVTSAPWQVDRRSEKSDVLDALPAVLLAWPR